MISRIALQSTRRTLCRGIRPLSTDTTNIDYGTGKITKLTDPKQPELGDYPDFKPEFAQFKDPYAKYDDQQHRRNFNDPMHMDEDLYDMWSPDYFNFVSNKTALKHVGLFFAGIAGFGSIIAYFQLNPEKPAMPRSYPFGGLAKELGSGSEETDSFYRVRPDFSAEKEAGFITNDSDVEENKKIYLEKNKDFLNNI